MEIEVVRKELNELLDTSGISAAHMARTLGWDYTNFIKFRTGQFDYGQAKVNELGKLVEEYKKAFELLK